MHFYLRTFGDFIKGHHRACCVQMASNAHFHVYVMVLSNASYRSKNDLQGYRLLVSTSLASKGSGTDMKQP